MSIQRVKILGVPVDCVGWSSALQAVEEMLVTEGPARCIMAVNPEKAMQARTDPAILKRLNDAGLLIPDGIGIVWAVRILGMGKIERVPGSELMPAICDLAARKGHKVFLYGAKPEVNARAVEVLQNKYPGLCIAGRQDGYLSVEQMPGLVDLINASGAQVLFVALGSPKQEIWMAHFAPRLKVKICQGVGGTFDVIAGTVQRAPVLFRRLHLEWLYRLVTDPKRAGRQSVLPVFAWNILRQGYRSRRTAQ